MIAMNLLGDSPGEIIVIGVQPLSTEWSAELTVPVRASLDELLTVVIAQLDSWASVPD
jgi:Ni,Fe-hydrogenase maturation factor